MNITEWANLNGMTSCEFKDEIVETLVAIGSMDMDEVDKDSIAYSVADPNYEYQVTVARKALL